MKKLGLLIAIFAISTAANAAFLQNRVQNYKWQSGPVAGKTTGYTVVATHRIRVPDAIGMRLHFSKEGLPANTFIRLSTALGQHVQTFTMDDRILRAYHFTTPYLNGSDLILEVIAGAGVKYAGLTILGYEAPRRVEPMTESICGKEDNRIPSQTKEIARMMQSATGDGGCTGTLIGLTCMVSAGHCVDYLNIAQFNVPMSSPAGKAAFPAPEHQYPLDKQMAHQDGGPGADWAVYRVTANPVSKAFAGAIQGYKKIAAKMPNTGDILRITGYGSASGEKNFAQQTHFGPLLSVTGSTLKYEVDTMPGNSGSTVILEATQEIIGIHTHGGCSTSPGSANMGTALATKPDFQAAVKACLDEDAKLIQALKNNH